MKKFIAFMALAFFCSFISAQEFEEIEPTATAASAPEVIQPTPVVKYSKADLQCLADNIYAEARGEGEKGMLAVAYVTINRALHSLWPDTVCGVVRQKWKSICQFSWVCNPSVAINRTSELYQQSVEIAKNVLYGYHPEKDPTKGATMFHNIQVRPSWSERFKKTVQIRNHLFYQHPSKSGQSKQ
jgi:spore germination cell wall hydrolase CwlJ-like protein